MVRDRDGNGGLVVASTLTWTFTPQRMLTFL